jgi:hypothetical protein
MSEENLATGDRSPDTPEQGGDLEDVVLHELAVGHDQQGEQLRLLQSMLEESRAELLRTQNRLAELESIVASQSEELSTASAREGSEGEVQQKPDTVRDIERLAIITGRPIDDIDLIKLNLRLKFEQFRHLTEAYDSQGGNVRQEGFMQDVATAKRELEEAMYLYDPKFEEMRQKEERIKAQLSRTTDSEERRSLRNELFRLREERASPRRTRADRLTSRLDEIVASLDGSEILSTYELHQIDNPAEPLSSRRRTDSLDWRGKPEYDESGIYIGSSPERNGKWVLEPKPPLELNASGLGPQEEGPQEEGPQEEGPQEEGPQEEGPEEEDPQEEDPQEEGPEEEDPQEEDPEFHIVEVPPIDPGDYPELYARRKNLVGGDIEALQREAERLSHEIEANVRALVNNYIAENPKATVEQIRQYSLQCYVEAQNKLQEDVIDAIDGRGYTDAQGQEKGKSRLRRFGAWMDKHGSKLKKGMLIVGGAGAIVLTGGVLAGAIVPAFALGAGTVFGAAKGATIGLGMSRHGSRESASRSVGLEQMSNDDAERYARISEYIMDQYNAAADSDHRTNVKKSRRAAIVGAVIGGLAGSISFSSPHTVDTTKQIEVPNKSPEIPRHTIESGELTGQVIDKTLSRMGIDGSRFVNPDSSTNMDAIYEFFSPKQWHNLAELDNGTHSMAGAENLSNEGIKHIIQTIVNNHDWGTHLKTIGSSITDFNPNLPATIAGWVTGDILAAAAARQAAESVKPVPSKKKLGSRPVIVKIETPPSVPSGDRGPTPIKVIQTTTSPEKSTTYKFGEAVRELTPGNVYGLTTYISGSAPSPKPIRFVRMNGNSYVFDDLEHGGQITYGPNQMDGRGGWLQSGRIRREL